MERRSLVAGLATMPLLAAFGQARAQAAWPSRPIRLIEPGAPGNGNDTVARLFALHLERILGQPLVVDNRGGAGGRIGVEAAWRSPAVELMVDAHWRFSAGGAAALIRDLAPCRPYWLECPVAEANHAELRRLRGMANDRGMRLAGAGALPQRPGLGLALDEAAARAAPWVAMPEPWLDPRLG